MEKLILKPSIQMYPAIKVEKDTEFEYENENVKQELKDLTFKSITNVKGENFESEYHTTIHLNEGEYLVFEDEGRGYIKPVEDLVTIEEAIKDLQNIKE